MYLRNDVTCAPPPSSCYRPLVTAANVPPGTKIDSGPEGLTFLAATPNLSDTVLADIVPLTSEPAAAGGNLYEWASSGTLQLVNVLPTAEGGTPAANPNLGADNKNVRHALSDDGKRVIWTTGLASGSEGAESLYMRDMEKHETLRLDVGEHGPEKAAAAFQAASADGSKAFFTDQNAFSAGSRATTESPDLYVCEIVEQAEKPACELHDLSIDTNPNGERAGVQGVVDVSEDGSTVYFVANGVLSAAANAQDEKATPGGCASGGRPIGRDVQPVRGALQRRSAQLGSADVHRDALERR